VGARYDARRVAKEITLYFILLLIFDESGRFENFTGEAWKSPFCISGSIRRYLSSPNFRSY
jgi:hypothetical protein